MDFMYKLIGVLKKQKLMKRRHSYKILKKFEQTQCTLIFTVTMYIRSGTLNDYGSR